MANADRNALLLRLREDFLRVGCGKGHRLFNQHIFPVRDAVKRNCGMIAALRRNGAAIDRKLLKRFFIIRVNSRTISGGGLHIVRLLLRQLNYRIADSDKLACLMICSSCRNVILGNTAAADKHKTQLFHIQIPPFRPADMLPGFNG